MLLFYLSAVLAVVSSVLYHVFIKVTPADANPALSLAVAYSLAALLCLGLLLIYPLKTSLSDAFKQLNWASFALAFALVGLETGFLLAYRAGWNVSVAAIIVNMVVMLLLIPIGLSLFDEKLSAVNGLGILLSIAGLILANIKG